MWKAYTKTLKAFVDKDHGIHMKLARSISGTERCFFCNNDQLCPMNKVGSNPLLEGHTFLSKYILPLWVAEEANLQGIVTQIDPSDDQHFTVVGHDFYVRARFTELIGWCTHSVVCWEGGDVL